MLSVIHTSIRSYNKNFSEFEAILTNSLREFDIIGLSETWDTLEKPAKLRSLPGYHPPVTTKARTQNGGTLLHIKESMVFDKREDLSGENINNSESSFIEIHCDGKNIIAGVIYRHPNTNSHAFVNDLNIILPKLLKEKKQIVIIGDFNTDLLKVNDHKESERFLDTMLDNDLMPYICQPTRFDENMKATLIDNLKSGFNRNYQWKRHGIGIRPPAQFCLDSTKKQLKIESD